MSQESPSSSSVCGSRQWAWESGGRQTEDQHADVTINGELEEKGQSGATYAVNKCSAPLEITLQNPGSWIRVAATRLPE
jgi:hypothetical protein